MADRFAVNNGDFNSITTWSTTNNGSSGASVPVSGDVAYTNGKTVTITTNVTCTQMRSDANGVATVGGSFNCSTSGITITTDYIYANGYCIYLAHNSGNVAINFIVAYGAYINQGSAIHNAGNGTITTKGYVVGGDSANSYGINNFSNGTVYHTGNASAGYRSAGIFNNLNGVVNVYGNGYAERSPGIYNYTTGTINIVGNLYGGGISNTIGTSVGAYNLTGTMNVTGSIYGGHVAGGTGYGIQLAGAGTTNIIGNDIIGGLTSAAIINSGSGVINLTGTVSASNSNGSYSINNQANGSIKIFGDVLPPITSNPTIYNSSTGIVEIYGTVYGNDYGLGSTGISNIVTISTVQNAITRIKKFKMGSRGLFPFTGTLFIMDDLNNNTADMTFETTGSNITLVRPDLPSQGQANPSDVKKGVFYANGNLVGTVPIPDPINVVSGIPVGDTVGTGVITSDQVANILGNMLTSLN